MKNLLTILLLLVACSSVRSSAQSLNRIPPTVVDQAEGRTFYVATNGVNSTAVMNDRLNPYAPIWNTNLGVLNLATNHGDVIKVLPGRYWLSNSFPVWLREGVTLEGIAHPCFSVDTNGPDTGRLDFSTFQPSDNVTIRGIVWEATNQWTTTDVGGHPYASFICGPGLPLTGKPGFTNVLIENCILLGGSDVFYGGNGNANERWTLRHCIIKSLWDIFSTSSPGDCVSVENIWFGQGAQSRPTRINNGNTRLEDFGSLFYGFAGMDGSHGINGAFMPHGTIFNLTTPSENFLAGAAATLGGDYRDAVTGKTFSIGPEQAQWYTNAFTTNFVYAFNLSNIVVSAGNPDANVNGTYLLGTTDGDFANGKSFWTNQSHTTYVLRLNDPSDVGMEGAPPTGGIYNGNTSVSLGGAFYLTLTGAGQNVINLSDGATTCTATLTTNSITTNVVNVLVPSVFNRAVVFATNTVFAASGITWAGNGWGLTNLNVNTGGVTWATNSTLPANTTTIRSWLTITNQSGKICKIPVYE